MPPLRGVTCSAVYTRIDISARDRKAVGPNACVRRRFFVGARGESAAATQRPASFPCRRAFTSGHSEAMML